MALGSTLSSFRSRFAQIQQTCFPTPVTAVRPPHLLTIFWQHYAPDLRQHYPGITLPRLIQEWHTQEWFDEEAWYFFDPGHPLSKFLVALHQGIPWGYFFGRQYFYATEFLVGPATLIPRPETELLVDLVRKMWHQKVQHESLTAGTWLDVATGCGNILLSLLPHALIPIQAYGSDLQESALRLARQNNFWQAYRWGLPHQVQWIQSDRLKNPILQNLKFDLITANPPYLKQQADQSLVHAQVAQYEPASALYLPDQDYQNWFREFFQQVATHLAARGIFFMEGHSAYLQELADVATTEGLQEVQILADLTGRARFLVAYGK